FDESLRMGEDLLFNLEYLTHCQNIDFTTRTFYTYLISNTESVSYELPDNYFDNQIYLFQKTLDFFTDKREITKDKYRQKLNADFMKNISNYMKKASSAYDQETFVQLMKENILTKESKSLIDRISLRELTRAQKALYILLKARQF